MRLSIRAEQKTVIETVARENFVRRIADHLLEQYAKAIVTLPTNEKLPVDELPEETLYDLVRAGIERAKSHSLSFENSIAAFTALMFEVSPNFDQHRLCQVLLNDEDVEPDARLDELMNVLTEKNWESIREDYDPDVWKPEAETDNAAEATETAEDEELLKRKNLDLQETVMNPS